MKTYGKNIMVFALLTVLFSGCTSEKEEMAKHHFENKIFINTEETVVEKILKANGEGEYSQTLSVSTALPVDEKVSATFEIDSEKLADFQEAYEKDACLFPIEQVHVENEQVVIEKGTNLSGLTFVKFQGLDQLNMDNIYVLPISLENVKGIEMLESKRTIYYMFKGGALINVVCNMYDNRAGVKSWAHDVFHNMTSFTIEFLVRPNKFGRLISTVLGVEGHFLLRFGDAGVPDNQLQIAAGNNHTNSDLQVETGVWTHFAIVVSNGKITVYKNGSEKLSEYDNMSQFTFRPYGDDPGESNDSRYFWLGYSYSEDRYLDGELSEVRIWTKALTKEEINAPAHFYTVDPNSPDLGVYWKCDDGTGLVLKDSTPNHNDLILDKETKWPSVSLPAKI